MSRPPTTRRSPSKGGVVVSFRASAEELARLTAEATAAGYTGRGAVARFIQARLGLAAPTEAARARALVGVV